MAAGGRLRALQPHGEYIMKRFRLSFVSRRQFPGEEISSQTDSFDYLCEDLNEALRHAADCAKPEDVETVRIQYIKSKSVTAFGREYPAVVGELKT